MIAVVRTSLLLALLLVSSCSFYLGEPRVPKTDLRATLGSAYEVPPTQSRGSGSNLYFIGGIGYYNTRIVPLRFSDSNAGWNVGGGFKFPLTGFSAYVEARYHSIANTEVRFVPISFGLLF